jgi:hypothetical protein
MHRSLVMPKAWKIAPAKSASHWDLCHKKGCILLGWRELTNYSHYGNEDAVFEALGGGRGAAEMIWQFFDTIQDGDIIVANKGYRRIMGIGEVDGGYIPPKSHNHPAPNERLPHARRVKWRVVTSVKMPDYFFPQRTLAPLGLDHCDEIRGKYAKRHPGEVAKLNKLFANLTDHALTLLATDLEPPPKVEVTVCRIVRDTAVAAAVKRMHKHRCQICNRRIELSDGWYSEAHHIQPLGGVHKGPDVKENILCVCPNHHAELDYGARRLVRSHLYDADGHDVGMKFINYHNEKIYRG